MRGCLALISLSGLVMTLFCWQLGLAVAVLSALALLLLGPSASEMEPPEKESTPSPNSSQRRSQQCDTGPGYYKGRLFTEYVEQVKTLKREQHNQEAVILLAHLCEAAEEWAITQSLNTPVMVSFPAGD